MISLMARVNHILQIEKLLRKEGILLLLILGILYFLNGKLKEFLEQLELKVEESGFDLELYYLFKTSVDKCYQESRGE